MLNQRLRLLYLYNALPPGGNGQFPSINPAGPVTETRMVQALQHPPCFDWLRISIGQGDLSK
jgi:hypothetical protein